MKQPLKKARCCSTERLQTSRPSQGKLAGLGALVCEAVVAKFEVPKAAVTAEGDCQGLAERESSGVLNVHAAALPLAQETRTCRGAMFARCFVSSLAQSSPGPH